MFDGTNLKSIRNKKGLTQTLLAEYVEISQESIASYEANTRTPSADMIEALADVLDISIDELYGRTPVQLIPENHWLNQGVQEVLKLSPKNQGLFDKELKTEFVRLLQKYH